MEYGGVSKIPLEVEQEAGSKGGAHIVAEQISPEDELAAGRLGGGDAGAESGSILTGQDQGQEHVG